MDKTLDYLYNLERFGIKLGLEVMTELLQLFDNPQKRLQAFHLAGTNGKGSTANFINSVLKKADYKVGLYTSPHLVRFNERIKINDVEISDDELIGLTKQIKEKIEENNLQPTFFEFTTVLAFLYFAQQKCDYVVIETGMGGRLDATNVLKPLVSVITNISLDHTKYLGETKLEIAREKAAIVKENGILVTGEEDSHVLEFFEQVCMKKKAKFFVLKEIEDLKINMLGKHQLKNAALAKKAIGFSGINVSIEAMEGGLLEAKWPGRLEVVCEKPLIILDGAHNVVGMTRLQEFISDFFIGKNFARKILVLGMAEDKEISEMVSLIVPEFDEVILTQGNFKPSEMAVIEKEVLVNGIDKIRKICHPKKAMEEMAKVTNRDDFVLVTGSLYLIGDVIKYIPDCNKLFK